ncbi:MAG: aminotransferase class I/II-fold pyridoxal phosphate-dependent enzyme [Clostridia bacterium]|nr:aminotransferase class I/II-fold pyridoxal phosphate-dependent enzyme [Clostridia bacterium]
MKYENMSAEQLNAEKDKLQAEYDKLKAEDLKLNMARGILSRKQLDLTQDMLGLLKVPEDCISEDGVDCRNYGMLEGIPEARKLFADILGVPVNNIIVGGNSSLNLMYDSIARAMLYGVAGGSRPWGVQGEIKFLCPVPGYDRHFTICESLGIDMITVPMTADGPDMDEVEKLVSSDKSIKGIWCVPKYSNPEGTVYSDETVRRFASLRPAADDFRIFWDNAYVVHSFEGDPADQLNLFEEAKKFGNEDIVYIFASTSKISYPGSGISAFAASDANIAFVRKQMSAQTIGPDKLNQLRHVKFFGSAQGILDHMKKHAEIIAPKFALIEKAFTDQLTDAGVAEWTHPKGGYFVSLNVLPGTAARVFTLMTELGIKLTPVGATFPYHKDPDDKNLRIAPTYPPLEELETAVNALCICVKLAAAEKILNV